MTRSGNKNCNYDSLAIKQAQHKNFALEEHMELVKKVIRQEKHRREDEIDKAHRVLQKELEKVRSVKPLPGYALNRLHEERKKRINDICLHVVNCYMQKQDQNKTQWNKAIARGRMSNRPVCTPEHFRFVNTAFPEVINSAVPPNWKCMHNKKANIYEHGRAGHDMKCMSTRAKPVGESAGAFPGMDLINVRLWHPPSKYLLQPPCDESPSSGHVGGLRGKGGHLAGQRIAGKHRGRS